MKHRILIVALLLMTGLSCQTITQPTPSTIPVTRTVHVSGGGLDIEGAMVQLYRADLPSPTKQQPTAPDGTTSFPANVPAGWQSYVCVVTASDYPTLPPNNYLLGCSDTTLEIILRKQVTEPCGRSDIMNARPDTVCLHKQHIITSPSIHYTCPYTLAVSATSTLPSEMSYTLVKSNGSSTSTLAPGEEIYIKVTYTPTAVATSSGDVILTFSSTSPPVTYTFHVTGVGQDCNTCPCPSQDYPLLHRDTVCKGESKIKAVDLSTIVNTNNRSCVYDFYLEKNFKDSNEIRLSSQSFSVAGGQAATPITITFSPGSTGTYDDMCTFGIRAAGTNCPQHCTIHFVGIGGDQACQIDLAKSTLLNGEKLVLRNCVDNADSSKTVCIVNTGLCPTTAAVSWQRVDPQWIVDAPSTANIQPGASQCFTVRFAPTAANVWLPKGRGNQPAITDFSNTLVVSGCTSQPYPITGHPDTNCGKNLDDCLQDYNLIHEAIDLNLNKSLGKNDTTLAGAVFYVTAITGPGGTATLSSGGSNPPTTQFAFFDKIDNNKTITEICDPTVRANYLSSIPTHSAAAYLPSVSVGIGDVIAFSLYYGGTYCYGLMWVKDINWDRDPSLPGRQLQVCFQFCYPIKCD